MLAVPATVASPAKRARTSEPARLTATAAPTAVWLPEAKPEACESVAPFCQANRTKLPRVSVSPAATPSAPESSVVFTTAPGAM